MNLLSQIVVQQLDQIWKIVANFFAAILQQDAFNLSLTWRQVTFGSANLLLCLIRLRPQVAPKVRRFAWLRLSAQALS